MICFLLESFTVWKMLFQRHLINRYGVKSGGYLVIEPTEAMVVIDVNTGKYEGKKKLEETVLKINLEAAAEIARQLRLRNLSGIIMVDFIDMNQEANKEALMDALRAAVAERPGKNSCSRNDPSEFSGDHP